MFDAVVFPASVGHKTHHGRSGVAAAYRSASTFTINARARASTIPTNPVSSIPRSCLPEGAPEWMRDREQLWNAAEAAEQRRDAQVVHEACPTGPVPSFTFHRAYRRATHQAFLEAHEYAFGYFGGVFRILRYDNLKAAVKKILRGL
jgi:hypothetical protein